MSLRDAVTNWQTKWIGDQKIRDCRSPCYGKVYAFEWTDLQSCFHGRCECPKFVGLTLSGLSGKNDPIYQNTRKLILSSSNPYFFREVPEKELEGHILDSTLFGR
jgi:meiotically up-regulated gene 157 (Mug157) protein